MTGSSIWAWLLRVFAGLALVVGAALPTAGVQAAGTSIPRNVRFDLVASGLVQPLFVTHAGDGTNRLFVVERGGKIRIFKNGALNAIPFLDVSASVNTTGAEQGLLGLAFAPDYPVSRRFYVAYVKAGSNTVALARFLVSSVDPDRAIVNSRKELLAIPKSRANHNGGMLVFGPDGYLYMTVGDGGGAGDPDGNGQKKSTLLGKILRLDVSGSAYTVPPDNPFVGQTGARAEIWAYGLRNPWRISFDRLTGDLYIGDVGQNVQEEVDFQPALGGGGENYGWNIFEGNLCYLTAPCTPPPGYAPPVTIYDHGINDWIGCSISGGYVYRGSQFTALRGVYLYADFCTGRVWGLKKSADGKWLSVQIRDTDYMISSFGEDQQGELYIADFSAGTIRRLAEAPIQTALFRSQAGRDGLIIEQSENSSTGGYTNSSAGYIRLGDNAQNEQIVGILSFDTGTLPDNAEILSAAITVRKGGQTGIDPFSELGQLQADIRQGYFGTLPALQAADFQAPASRASVGGGVMALADGFYRLAVRQAGPYVNRSGLTQFRLYFAVQDNNNLTADAVSIYSGESAVAGNKPRLVLSYFLTE